MTAANAARRAVAAARSIEQGLRSDVAAFKLQHPQLQTIHARLLQAADCVKPLADLLVRTLP